VLELILGVFLMGASGSQEAAVRMDLERMQPEVMPSRVIFLSHKKYLEAATAFTLHVPKGYQSLMFTHLPSRTVFIDNSKYQDEKWLGYWLAHELGHLASNSTLEGDAERFAKIYRRRL
jgi:hypothetical protein